MINIIVALDKNFLIGKNGGIPWDIPEDLHLFKEKTTNNIIIMGRKTFESIGRALPNRINIVISKTLKNSPEIKTNLSFEELSKKEIIFSSLEEGINFSKTFIKKNNLNKDIFIIGGAQIYNECISKKYFDKLCISHINGDFNGDTYFPKIDFKDYKKIIEKDFKEFTYCEYENLFSKN